MAAKTPSILKSESSRAVWTKLMTSLRELGAYDVEEKKTSIHLARGRAFAGVHPRATGLVLQIVTDAPLKSPRVAKLEQVSKNRWHAHVKLESPSEVDRALMGWLSDAYALAELSPERVDRGARR